MRHEVTEVTEVQMMEVLVNRRGEEAVNGVALGALSRDTGAWTFAGEMQKRWWTRLKAGSPQCFRLKRERRNRVRTRADA